jgi:hypothetical protein
VCGPQLFTSRCNKFEPSAPSITASASRQAFLSASAGSFSVPRRFRRDSRPVSAMKMCTWTSSAWTSSSANRNVLIGLEKEGNQVGETAGSVAAITISFFRKKESLQRFQRRCRRQKKGICGYMFCFENCFGSGMSNAAESVRSERSAALTSPLLEGEQQTPKVEEAPGSAIRSSLPHAAHSGLQRAEATELTPHTLPRTLTLL